VFFDVLASLRREVRVYGAGTRPDRDGLRFCEVSVHGFLRDLASCRALVSTAGNQLVGEALYLGKPVLATPERNNFEQILNGHLLEQSRAGRSIDFDELTPARVLSFLYRLDEMRQHIHRDWLRGNERVFALLDAQLADPTAVCAPDGRRRAVPAPRPTSVAAGGYNRSTL
jgi:hypothetical protein